MLNEKYIGMVLLEMYDTVKVEKIGKTSNGEEWYFINTKHPEDSNGYFDLWKQDKMDQILSKQDYYKEIQEKRRIRDIEEEEEKERQKKLQAEKENLFGFHENKTAMQKGKVLKTLMKELRYNNKIITRKEFCIELLKQGYYSKITEYSNMYNPRAKNDYTKSIGLYHPTNNTFNEVTKTEYDFFNYLKENNIFKIEEIGA